jgi:hypothetical protein
VDREIHFPRGKKKNLAIRANRRISIMISLFPVVSRQRIHDWGEKKKKKRISFFFFGWEKKNYRLRGSCGGLDCDET